MYEGYFRIIYFQLLNTISTFIKNINCHHKLYKKQTQYIYTLEPNRSHLAIISHMLHLSSICRFIQV